MRDWHTFINNQRPSEQGHSSPVVLSALPPTGVLRISGADALSFLQGQSTCDVREISQKKSGMGAFCNPEGRVIATFRILREESDFFLLTAADLLQLLYRHLSKYVLRSDVRITMEDPALFGMTAMQTSLLTPLGTLPQTPDTVANVADMTWIRLAGSRPRWLLMGKPGPAHRLWMHLMENDHAAYHPPTFWQLQEILCGIPTVTQETSEAFLPQMLNLDALGAVSFDKGCYTGQEIIARTHYRGQVKRRTYRAKVDVTETPVSGDKLLHQGETVGQVIIAAPTCQGQELLAVVRCDRVHTASIHLEGNADAAIHWLDLAYTLPE